MIAFHDRLNGRGKLRSRRIKRRNFALICLVNMPKSVLSGRDFYACHFLLHGNYFRLFCRTLLISNHPLEMKACDLARPCRC